MNQYFQYQPASFFAIKEFVSSVKYIIDRKTIFSYDYAMKTIAAAYGFPFQGSAAPGMLSAVATKEKNGLNFGRECGVLPCAHKE